ncbi:DUF2306 domain-containing protein [Coralloluteibacterium stylophorae]|uniref:DUF2306 domain-containing protein n=1 Tax=Coralloluteibacterium stylophorae TaxID=1776034 RepID=A0A8J7VT82_9GAMM|nr:hypothetical protein [Coralloluteibacterium stylophorae]MBS7457167.1 hypothetical protein [Coralloluteibacterium stylophorae]
MADVSVVTHIVAGSMALVAGAVALYSAKGAGLHRASGMAFVYSMLIMSATGAVMAAFRSEGLSVVAGALTFYLVGTATLAVRRRGAGARWVDLAAMLAAFVIGAVSIQQGLEAARDPTGMRDGFPAPPYFVFGAVALMAALLDLRMVLANGVGGRHRLARHLWRMCFALFIAAASFFLGQAQVFPEPIRNVALLAVPVLGVLLTMLYWLWRVLLARRVPGAAPGNSPKPAPPRGAT